MNGEIDLELYAISIIRLNTAFEKINNSQDIFEIKEMLIDSYDNLNEFYQDVVNDLKKDEIQFSEYYLFFKNGKESFPKYIEILNSINEKELNEIIESLVNIFKNLNKITEAF